jgi:hypothetical protein
MKFLAAVLYITAVAIAVIYIASAVYQAYDVAGMQSYMLRKIETALLQFIGPWMPVLIGLLLLAALLYTGRKEA